MFELLVIASEVLVLGTTVWYLYGRNERSQGVNYADYSWGNYAPPFAGVKTPEVSRKAKLRLLKSIAKGRPPHRAA